MLIEFTFGNFRSFKEKTTLSLVASNLSSRNPELDRANTIPVDEDLTLLTSAAIYGANASGKSNLIKALEFMRSFVLNSSKETQADEQIATTPFRLSTETENQPSHFELVFLIDGIAYRYGFEVDTTHIVAEWLFYSPGQKEAKLFIREQQDIRISRAFKGGKASKSLTRPNALFLSVASQFNSETATTVLKGIRSIGVVSGLDDMAYSAYTTRKFSEDEIFRDQILKIIRGADVGITDVTIETSKIADLKLPTNMPAQFKEMLMKQLPEDGEVVSLMTSHTQWSADGSPAASVSFDLDEESEGTQKLLLISGPVIDTLAKGKTLVVDEIEARMHTLLTRKLVSLFNSPDTNPNHAQLIFATHDTNLLSKKLFRRDQIWFTEKDRQGASHLYSLAELKVRNDASFEDDYLGGKYGGIPLLGELRQITIGEA